MEVMLDSMRRKRSNFIQKEQGKTQIWLDSKMKTTREYKRKIAEKYNKKKKSRKNSKNLSKNVKFEKCRFPMNQRKEK